MGAKNTQFNKGNYNEWDTLVTKKLPLVDKTLRETILPKLDDTLTSMLGYYSDWTKEELNARPYVEEDSFKGVYIEISYQVEDFKVQNAPRDAVEEDETSISNYMTENTVEIISTEIDTTTGNMKIVLLYHFADNLAEENLND